MVALPLMSSSLLTVTSYGLSLKDGWVSVQESRGRESSADSTAEWDMKFPFTMMMEPGAIGVLSYAHHSIEEPALLIGMAFPSTD